MAHRDDINATTPTDNGKENDKTRADFTALPLFRWALVEKATRTRFMLYLYAYLLAKCTLAISEFLGSCCI